MKAKALVFCGVFGLVFGILATEGFASRGTTRHFAKEVAHEVVK